MLMTNGVFSLFHVVHTKTENSSFTLVPEQKAPIHLASHLATDIWNYCGERAGTGYATGKNGYHHTRVFCQEPLFRTCTTSLWCSSLSSTHNPHSYQPAQSSASWPTIPWALAAAFAAYPPGSWVHYDQTTKIKAFLKKHTRGRC